MVKAPTDPERGAVAIIGDPPGERKESLPFVPRIARPFGVM
jgi:hypothetical protein